MEYNLASKGDDADIPVKAILIQKISQVNKIVSYEHFWWNLI